jgi:hypothetical protein
MAATSHLQGSAAVKQCMGLASAGIDITSHWLEVDALAGYDQLQVACSTQ